MSSIYLSIPSLSIPILLLFFPDAFISIYVFFSELFCLKCSFVHLYTFLKNSPITSFFCFVFLVVLFNTFLHSSLYITTFICFVFLILLCIHSVSFLNCLMYNYVCLFCFDFFYFVLLFHIFFISSCVFFILWFTFFLRYRQFIHSLLRNPSLNSV